jgi:hypothetical protein
MHKGTDNFGQNKSLRVPLCCEDLVRFGSEPNEGMCTALSCPISSPSLFSPALPRFLPQNTKKKLLSFRSIPPLLGSTIIYDVLGV